MDRLSALMVRLSLCWLLVGAVLGGLMLSDAWVPGDWRVWFAPTHGHILFVGWFLQFALGIAYWLLPRKRTPEQPLGYSERLAYVAVAGLNAGLLLRVVAEPLEHAGHASTVTHTMLAVSAVLQVAAIALFVIQIWPRVGSRVRPRATSTKTDLS